MPDAAITAQEQLMLELVNRARLDPLAEAIRLGATGAALDAMNLPSGPLTPLAGNAQLSLSSAEHSAWMLQADTFSHTGAGGSSAGERMASAGYVFSGSWSWGENLAYRTSSGTMNATQAIVDLHGALFFSTGHRANILSSGFREIGIAQEFGTFNGWNATTITQNYARSGPALFLTGVVYDDVNRDGFYSIGEGRAGVTFATASATAGSAAAGGYAAALQSGQQGVVVTLADGSQTRLQLETVAGNIKLDLVDGARLVVSADATLLSGDLALAALGTADLTLTGHAGDNLLIGNSGDNRFDGSGGADTIIGGGGVDTVVLHGALADMTVSVQPEGVRITGPSGDSLFQGIAWFEADGDLFDLDALVAAIAAVQAAQPEVTLVAGPAAPAAPEETAAPEADPQSISEPHPAPDSEFQQGSQPLPDAAPEPEPAPAADPVPEILPTQNSPENDHGTAPDTAGPETTTQADSPAPGSIGAQTPIPAPPDPVNPADWPAGALLGTQGDDGLRGSDFGDLIVAGGGDDNIAGRGGNDTVHGGDGDDTIGAGTGDDLIHAGSGNDLGAGGMGNDTILAGPGHDTFSGGGGHDMLHGEGGDDWLAGGPGNDLVYGGAGDDNIGGGFGHDLILGGAGADVIGAGTGNDTVRSGAGDDFIGGGAGNDLIYGGDGNDTLQPGEGRDTVWGGAGADLFVFNAAHGGGRATVMDFEQGSDQIRITGMALAPGNVLTRLVPQDFAAEGRDGTLLLLGGREIVILGVEPQDLTASDFWFG